MSKEVSSGLIEFQIVNPDPKKLKEDLWCAAKDNTQACFTAIRLDDPSLSPEKIEFKSTIEQVRPKPLTFDLTDTQERWLRIIFPEGNEPITFKLLL